MEEPLIMDKDIRKKWYDFFHEKRHLYENITSDWKRLLPYFLQKEGLTINDFNEAKKRWW